MIDNTLCSLLYDNPADVFVRINIGRKVEGDMHNATVLYIRNKDPKLSPICPQLDKLDTLIINALRSVFDYTLYSFGHTRDMKMEDFRDPLIYRMAVITIVVPIAGSETHTSFRIPVYVNAARGEDISLFSDICIESKEILSVGDYNQIKISSRSDVVLCGLHKYADEYAWNFYTGRSSDDFCVAILCPNGHWENMAMIVLNGSSVKCLEGRYMEHKAEMLKIIEDIRQSIKYRQLMPSEKSYQAVASMIEYVQRVKDTWPRELDKAIDATLSDDTQERQSGLESLERLRGFDEAADFFIGYKYEQDFYATRNQEYARLAVHEYQKLMAKGAYSFLQAVIDRLVADAKLA